MEHDTSEPSPSTTANKPPDVLLAPTSQDVLLDPVEPEKKPQKKPKKPREVTAKANMKTTKKGASAAPKKSIKEAPERPTKDPPPKQQSCDNDGLMRAIMLLEATILTLQNKVDQMEATIALTLQPQKTMDPKPAKSPKQVTQVTQTPAVISLDQETQVSVNLETQVPANQETQVLVNDLPKAPYDPVPAETIFSFPDPEQPLSRLPGTSSTTPYQPLSQTTAVISLDQSTPCTSNNQSMTPKDPAANTPALVCPDFPRHTARSSAPTTRDSAPSLQSPPNLDLIRTGLLRLAGQAPPPVGVAGSSAPTQSATRPAWGSRPIREGWSDPVSEPPQQASSSPINQPRYAPANSSRQGGVRSPPRLRERREKKILIIRDSMLRDFNAGKFFASGMKAEDLNLGSIKEALRETRRIRQSSGVDAYIIELGVNDLKAHTSHTVLTHLNDLISEIRSWAPHATILVSPPSHH